MSSKSRINSDDLIVFDKKNVNLILWKENNDKTNLNITENKSLTINPNETISYEIDLNGSYPLENIILFLKDSVLFERLKQRQLIASVNYSLDNKIFSEQLGGHIDEGKRINFNLRNTQNRYVKINIKNNESRSFDIKPQQFLDGLKFNIGVGIAVTSNESWTELFSRIEGWTGADGIYSVPVNIKKNGNQTKSENSIFVFGDTFIGDVDRNTKNRLNNLMVNNTLGYMTGNLPEKDKLEFIWNQNQNGPKSMFQPETKFSKELENPYYWLQDGIIIDNKFYCLPLIVGPNPNGREGFEFKVHGIACVSADIKENGVNKDSEKQIDTPLHFKTNQGIEAYFGAGFMHLEKDTDTREEMIYIYGLFLDGDTKLISARVSPDKFTQFDQWKYWNGNEWSENKEEVAPIAREISSEFSVSVIENGRNKGKYIVVFQEWEKNNRLSAYIGETPVGPFQEEPMRLHYIDEHEKGNGIYVYNAKAHPHLKGNGDLLASYNVNTSSWEMHEEDGTIYRPRFIDLTFT